MWRIWRGGSDGFAFASGMAAVDTLMHLLEPGDHVLAMNDLYGGTWRLFERVRRRSSGLEFSFVDLADMDAARAAVTDRTRMIWVETPTNPMLQLVDIAAMAELAREIGARLVVDNTFATSDVAGSRLRWVRISWCIRDQKYLNGHSDMVGRSGGGHDAELAEQIGFLQKFGRGHPGAVRCVLVMRGVKTLALLMKAHCENGPTHGRNGLNTGQDKGSKEKVILNPGLDSHYRKKPWPKSR